MTPRLEALLDLVWPRATPFAPEQAEAIKARQEAWRATARSRIDALRTRPAPGSSTHSLHIIEATVRVEALLAQERVHVQSVDARLLGMLGQTSVAAALIVAALTSKDLRALAPSSLRVALVLLLLYMIVQLLVALRASLSGLERRGYLATKTPDEFPDTTQSDVDFAVQRLSEYTESLLEAKERTNEKVTQMAVAHCAFRNFLWAALVFSVALAIVAVRAVDAPDGVGKVISTTRHLR